MAETADDLSTPLGQTTVRPKRRFRLPFTGIQALAVLFGLFLLAFAGFAIFNDNPLGGEPIARVALRLTTARYFTPSGKSIQAKGIVPDIEVLQDVPDELKSRTDTKGEASLRGHLKNDGDEKTGSQSYVPPDAKDDKALKMAADLLHGVKVNATAPATGDKAAIDKPANKAAN